MKTIILSFLLVLFTLSCEKQERDLELLCDYAKIELNSASSATEKASNFSKFVDLKVKNPKLKLMFETMSSSDPQTKLDLYKRTLQEMGIENWSCPELETIFSH